MKTLCLLGLAVLLTVLNTTRGSLLGDNDLGQRREAADEKPLDILVDYLIKRIQSEQERPSYSGSLVKVAQISQPTFPFTLISAGKIDSQDPNREEARL